MLSNGLGSVDNLKQNAAWRGPAVEKAVAALMENAVAINVQEGLKLVTEWQFINYNYLINCLLHRLLHLQDLLRQWQLLRSRTLYQLPALPLPLRLRLSLTQA